MTQHFTHQAGWSLQHTYTALPEIFYSHIQPNKVSSPDYVLVNDRLAEELGLNPEGLRSDENLNRLAGNVASEQAIAQAYAGHQFGYFNMLGDGRALLLGEQKKPNGQIVDIQLKGSGRTPYSRGGDGRAALGPMLREYIISEAMHGLGILTTRSLAVVATGEPVYRETVKQGAVLTRVAASHLRVGTFQFAAKWGGKEALQSLSDYAIERHYAELKSEENPYFAFLMAVIKRQAALIAKWQHVGFIHGVMNTDNMTISGETIDYGPCAFMDTYNPATVFSSIDRDGRYAYYNQPHIGGWNLARFAESLIPLLHEDQDEAIKLAQQAIEQYSGFYQENWLSGMRSKLGLFNEEQEDLALANRLLELMEQHRADYTNTFRALTLEENTGLESDEGFNEWLQQWNARLDRQEQSLSDVQNLMKSANPSVIPRNHLVEEALEAAESGDLSKVEKLLEVVTNPYEYRVEEPAFCRPGDPDRGYQTYCGT
ncbi:protein adenylyltransferase SelO [Jeotgalibacillus aurantiacus]|uniref:protein adenylyltransferase SelO n=1 Tax=Jeotgalibacillus aurantiacus TaxID=2763266 RepID=UPI001D0AFB12|nr:YdiU family protein [Jeotgalibacillus aurantiacus]